MEDRYLPSSRTAVHVNTVGAVIVDEDVEKLVQGAIDGLGGVPGLRDSKDIYLPKHTEWISHIAVDIGGSLAKVVYFSRAPHNSHLPDDHSCSGVGRSALNSQSPKSSPSGSPPPMNGSITPVPNGVLGPESLASANGSIKSYFDQSSRPHSLARTHKRNSFTAPIPGGWLNFTKFETGDMENCTDFINQLIESSSASHHIPSAEFKARHVKIMATGGGAHLYHQVLSNALGVEVRKEEEMECLIEGLTFFMEIPHEVFWYSDELVDQSHNPQARPFASLSTQHSPLLEDLPRPSPNPPQYSLLFDDSPTPQFPCMLVNIGSGVSVIKVDDYGKYERISGTSLGGGTLWGLLSLLTGAETFDEMLALSEQGDNSTVDMLVGDIYGSDYSKIGLKSSTIASSFGKVFRKGTKGKAFRPEDIAKSLLYAVSNNIGQIAYMNAEKHNLDRIYFGGCFIRGHAATISTLSYAIRFWSKGAKKALFLRHEGYLGAIGAWLRNIEEDDNRR